MTQPTDLPGRSLFDETTPVSVAPTSGIRQRDNEFALAVFLDAHPLPAPSISPRPDGVFVTVADVDDLGPWLTALEGKIHCSPVFEGLSVWTLHAELPRGRRDDGPVAVRVSCAVLADELVMHYIRQAVKA